jgi:tetratricopeptide (TPR) repeat protein
LCLVPFLAYVHTVSYDFVWDDEVQILRNPWIHDWSKVGQFFTTDVWAFSRKGNSTNYYRPLHMIAHAAGYSLSGFRPEGYHLMNILLHVVNTLLLALIGLRLTREKSIALLAGALFALHPVHAESVTWIAGVTDPLCALFYFAALYLYLKDPERHGTFRTSAGILLFFFCALLSKEMAVTFPLVALWFDWCLNRKLRWHRYGMMLGVGAAYALLRTSALGQFIPKNSLSHWNSLTGALSLSVLVATYLVKLFIPYGISAFHVFHPVRSILDARFAAGLAALLIFALAAWWRRNDRTAVFLFGFSLLSLLPLMNIGGETLYADRYLYIPSLGSCLLIPLLVQYACKRHPAFLPPRGDRYWYILLSPLLLIYGVLLVHASFLWRSSPILYTESLVRSPDSIDATSLLAQYYFYRADYAKAEPLFRRVIELSQDEARENHNLLSAAYAGLGGIQFYRNNLEQAKQYMEKSYDLNPHDEAMLQNFGSVDMLLHDYSDASRLFQEALAANPRNEVAYNNLAAMYVTLGQYPQAIFNAQKAIEIFPNFGKAYINLAEAYEALGMENKAREAYLKAAQVDPAQKAAAGKALEQLETSVPHK